MVVAQADQMSPDPTSADQTPQSKSSASSTPAPQPNLTPAANRVQKRSKRQSSLHSAPETLAKALSANSATPSQVKLEASNSPAPTGLNPLPETNDEGNKTDIISNIGYTGKEHASVEARQPLFITPPAPQSRGCCSTKPPSTKVSPTPTNCCSSSRTFEDVPSPVKSNTVNNNSTHSSPSPAMHGYPSTYPRPHLQHKSFSTTSVPNQATAFANPHFPDPAITGYEQPTFSPGATDVSPAPTLTRQYSSFDHSTVPHTFSAGITGGSSRNFSDALHDPGHNCGCGEGCQCLGCASHPFNDTTRNYIQEMGYMMALSGNEQGIEANVDLGNSAFNNAHTPTDFHHPSFSFGGSEPSGIAQGYAHSAEPQHFTSFDNNPSILGPPSYQDSHSELMMRPAAYYTVEYPVSMLDPCSNIMGTCQCGINCKCVGCLTHSGHDGITLEPSPPPEETQVNLINSNMAPSQANSLQFQPQTSSSNQYGEYYSSPAVTDPPLG